MRRGGISSAHGVLRNAEQNRLPQTPSIVSIYIGTLSTYVCIQSEQVGQTSSHASGIAFAKRQVRECPVHGAVDRYYNNVCGVSLLWNYGAPTPAAPEIWGIIRDGRRRARRAAPITYFHPPLSGTGFDEKKEKKEKKRKTNVDIGSLAWRRSACTTHYLHT